MKLGEKITRAKRVWEQLKPTVYSGWDWIIRGKEVTNFTYPITELCRTYLAWTTAHVVQRPVSEIESYFTELENNFELKQHVISRLHEGSWGSLSDDRFDPGRRLVWYALARAMKPQIIIESGCERGYGAMCLISALMYNGSGRYYGLDISPRAGWLVSGKYREWGEILYGDAINSIKVFKKPIDMYINDSDHSYEYEAAEYTSIADKLAKNAIIVSDNAHVTPALEQFSRLNGRRFLFAAEESVHWTRPPGVGISW